MSEYNTLLSQDHLKMLVEGSGIAPEVIEKRGYRTCTGYSELKSLGIAVRRDTDTHGLLLPLHTVEGKPGETYIAREDRRVPLMVYRPDTPQIDQEGQPQKYLSPGSQRSRLDCHPRSFPLLGDPTVTLWITEGTKKADSLVTQGQCALALLGVWNWRGANAAGGEMALPDWHDVALNGRDVRIVYDSDIAEKPSVAQALHELSGMLTAKGAHVHVAYLPSAEGEKVGVDDYLLTHTVADLEHLLEAPRPLRRGSTAAVQAMTTLKLTKTGEPRPVVSNILEILSKDARWAGVFGYDAFAQCTTLLQRPPYLEGGEPWMPRPVEDHDDSETSNWLQQEYNLCAATPSVAEAIQTLAHRAPFHPIQQYLEGLTWDRTLRLETWLSTYCGAEDTPYTRAVGPKTLLSAVARVEAPGCKADCVTILQGEQGLGKSTAWRVLSGDAWFSDTLPDIHRKDAMEGLHGKWLVELGELAVLQRSEREALKRFVSAPSDHYRPSYGRRAATFPRQVIFVGTTNKEEFLQDETGNRRWWPIKVTGPCDTQALQRDRDQLWAEAVVRYRQGAIWYLTPAEEALAGVEQEERFEVDPWEELVMDYVRSEIGAGETHVTTRDILVKALQLDNPALYTQQQTKRIGAILRRHQWQGNKPVWITTTTGEKKQIKAWKPPIQDKALPVLPIYQETGNAISGNENNAVTGVTDVTCPLISSSSGMESENKKHETHFTQAIWESGVTTGNAVTTGNRGQSPQGPPASAVAGLSAVNGAAPDCLPPPCTHPETTTETMNDGSTLVRCVTCRHLEVKVPERRS